MLYTTIYTAVMERWELLMAVNFVRLWPRRYKYQTISVTAGED